MIKTTQMRCAEQRAVLGFTRRRPACGPARHRARHHTGCRWRRWTARGPDCARRPSHSCGHGDVMSKHERSTKKKQRGGNDVPFKRLGVVALLLSLLTDLVELLWRLAACTMPSYIRATRHANQLMSGQRLHYSGSCKEDVRTQELLEFGLGDAASLLVLLFHRITRSQGCAVAIPSIKLVIPSSFGFSRLKVPASPDRDFTALGGLLLKSRLAVNLSLAIYKASANAQCIRHNPISVACHHTLRLVERMLRRCSTNAGRCTRIAPSIDATFHRAPLLSQLKLKTNKTKINQHISWLRPDSFLVRQEVHACVLLCSVEEDDDSGDVVAS